MRRALIILGMLIFTFCFLAHAAEEAYWKRTAELVAAGDYNAALQEADRLLAERREDVLLLRIRGICFMELGNQEEAIAMFRRALAIDPTNVASRYYLAQALAYSGDVPQAVNLLKQIQKEAPDSAYAQQAAKVSPYLENLAVTRLAAPKGKRWDVSFRVGGEYDDNVTGRSRKEQETQGTDAGRFISSAYLELRPLDEEIDRSWATLGLGYGIYQSFHERRQAFRDFDLTSQSAKVYLRHSDQIGSMPSRVQISSTFADTRIGNDPYGHEVSVGPSMDLQWLSWATLSPSYSISWKEFENDTIAPELFSRDGHTQTAGGSQRFYLAQNNVVLNVSYFYHWNEARGTQFDTDGYDITGAVDLGLPWKFRGSGGITYSSDDYVKFTPDPVRLDDATTVFASISHPLWSDNVQLEFSYTHTTGDSTVDFADYRRNVYGLAVSCYY